MIVSKTPLRASFFGGGTDFSSYFENSSLGYGAVISTALDLCVYITVNKSFDNSLRLCYAGNELVSHVDEVKHNLIREALRVTEIDCGVEIIYSADIPLKTVGIGLASSSAIAVGVLNALYAYKGVYTTPEMLAKKACEIEIDRLGQRIGIQDQYAVAHGGFNNYRFNVDGTVEVIPVLCNLERKKLLEANLMLFFTGQSRDSSKILSEQDSTIPRKMELLDEMVQTVELANKYLETGEIDQWGQLLHVAWEKKKLYAKGVSNPMIDDMYKKARAAGAIGGKILGAGGGGFLLLYVPSAGQDRVRNVLCEFKELPMKFSAQGSRIVFYD